MPIFALLLLSAPPLPVDFATEIRPLLNEHCMACHGGVQQAGDVSFIYREQVVPPEGWAVEPGDADGSVLMERVTSDDPDLRMPPPEEGHRSLNEGEIALLRRWIEEGAAWSAHWSFEPPKRPAVPEVTNSAWPRNDVDRFVLARLESEQVTPAADAEPDRWLRRVSLGLVGLPPTVEERAAFLADVAERGEPAYEAVVDRLLASSHYGERWASVWLDLMRYADSKGLGQDGRRTAWPYRDWVVRAFNDDMPYDEFTRAQIAGDLLPDPSLDDLIATAGQRLTQTNEEGGTDDEEFRLEAVHDRVSTTWQTWMAVTIGCVQCHSHPYDPLRHEDYYRQLAHFNNTADVDLEDDWPHLAVPKAEANFARAEELDRQIAEARRVIFDQQREAVNAAAWSPLNELTGAVRNAKSIAFEQRDGQTEYVLGDTARNPTVTLESVVPDGIGPLTGIRFTGLPFDVKAAVRDGEWGFAVSRFQAFVLPAGAGQAKPRELGLALVIGDEPVPYKDPNESLKDGVNGFGAWSKIHHPRSGVFVLKEPVELKGGERLQVRMQFKGYKLGSFVLAARRGRLDVTDSPDVARVLGDQRFKQSRRTLADLKKQRAEIPSARIPILRERPAGFERPSYVFHRGNFLDKSEEVTPGLPASLSGGASAANRLELAEWIVSDVNPLAARVAVNRAWARLFGVGIVRTEEDFGSTGERPTHPALLDHLATHFRDDLGWRFKPLLREIVLSSTYRQSGAVRSELAERDPQNQLLARGPRFRLPAETVRDQALHVSGLLEMKLGGPPTYPPIPAGVWTPFEKKDTWKTPARGEPGRNRRSIYTYTKRTIPYPMFASFDAPSREFCAPRRLRSNTPVQSLETLNGETFDECAEALAARMRSADRPLRFGFLAAAGREPTPRELAALHSLKDQVTPMTDEDAALKEVARVLLNLDELFSN